MKKWKILIPSLTATISMPLFSLCGCVNDASDNIKLVQFDSQFGSYVPSIRVEAGKTIERPANPTREGYDFLTWYPEGTTKAFNFAQPIEDDMVLIAQWEPQLSPPPTDIILNCKDLTLNFDETSDHLFAQVLPKQAKQNVEWKSSKPTIAEVDPTTGKITAKAGGETTISVSPIGYPAIKATCTVTVIGSDDPTSVNISKKSLSLEIGKTDHLYAQVLPQKASQAVVWSSSEESVATVDEDGIVTAVAKGTTTITVASNEDPRITASCAVTVSEHIIPDPKSIQINKDSLSLFGAGTSEQLFAYVSPVEAKQDVTWTSDNEDVATVDEDGIVTAVGDIGEEATISAVPKDCEDLVTPAVCAVTIVEEPVVDSYQVTFNTIGGSTIPSETVAFEELAVKPQDPVKSGYEFQGWYTESTYQTEYNFTEPVVSDITLYAKWGEKTGDVGVSVLNPSTDGFNITQESCPILTEAVLEVTSTKTAMDENSVRVVIIDGQPIDNYEFAVDLSGAQATLTIPEDSVTGDIQVGFNVDTPEPQPNNFATDPWSTVCYYADQGIDKLCQAYECDQEDFVGQIRKIILNNQIHYVKVVGVNQDSYNDEQGQTQQAALTFQFDTVISNSSGAGLKIQWDKITTEEEEEYNTHNYWNSTVDNALNSLEENVEWRESTLRKSVYLMLQESNPALVDSIKDVNRSVNVFDETSIEDFPFEQITTQRKLFCPTLSNLFSNVGINNTNCELLKDDQEKVLYEAEGQPHQTTESAQYMYYANQIGDETVDYRDEETGKGFECLKITDTSQYGQEEAIGMKFWTASPFLQKKPKYEEPYSWDIDSDQCLFNDWISGNFNLPCVVPCFCI